VREKWSISRLSEETLIDRRTIKAVLRDKPTDGGVLLSEFIKACKEYWGMSGLDGARLRKMNEEADQIAMENEEKRGVIVEIAHLCKRLEPVYIGIKQRIDASKLSAEEKDAILNDLHSIHGIIRPMPSSEHRNGDSPAGPDTEAAPPA
jgi:hypothetical protein